LTQRLLATDLDGTFIGDGEAMSALWAELERAGILVAFSTGRHLPSIEAFYAEAQTSRRADACICMVGTEIWHRNGAGYLRDEAWDDVISEDWDKARVEEILRAVPEAEMQPTEWQSTFKSSYFLEDNAQVRLTEIRHRLEEEGLQAKVVYSAGRFLDLLPHRSGKGGAVEFLARGLGLAAGDVVTAGDTGNDLDMMRPELGFRSIAVGNAAEELRSHRAPNLYHAAAPYAAGIREGLVHHGWLEPGASG
jgi:sucrose-6F-phosphate phosphohydrolase